MLISFKSLEKFAEKVTWLTMAFLLTIGALMVCTHISPFWVDEWFIIYNLKTKTVPDLLGKLDLMQQFPRVHLIIIKLFTSALDYNYFSLRLPAYLVSICTMMFSYSLMKKLYHDQVFTRYLFVLILISSPTFTEYFVQTKQYSMDILLSIVPVWQLFELLKLRESAEIGAPFYLLCSVFLVAPFFSYTYPISVAPVYLAVVLQLFSVFSSNRQASLKRKIMLLQSLPLTIGVISIVFFYFLDLKQLGADSAMHGFWSFLLIDKDHMVKSVFTHTYTLFSQLGAGLLFETLFGVLGIVSFVYGIFTAFKRYLSKDEMFENFLLIYSTSLIILTLILFLLGKLPVGTPRLNAFTVPSIAILIIYFINRLFLQIKGNAIKLMLPALLYIGLVGNVFSKFINYFTDPVYKQQMKIYVSTEKAIQLAQEKKIPILITIGYTYPYEVAANPDGAPEPGIWALKTFPSYKMENHLALFSIKDINHVDEFLQTSKEKFTSVLVGDGVTFEIINCQ